MPDDFNIEEIIAEIKSSVDSASMPGASQSAPKIVETEKKAPVSHLSRKEKAEKKLYEKNLFELFASDEPAISHEKKPSRVKKSGEKTEKPQEKFSTRDLSPNPKRPEQMALDFEKEKIDPVPSEKSEEKPENDIAEAQSKHLRSSLSYDFVNKTYEDASDALKHISARIRVSGIRLAVLFGLTFISLYMTLTFSFGLPMPFGFTYFNHPFMYLLVLFLCDALAVIVASDVTVAGFLRIIKLHPTMDSLVLFSSVCSMAYTLFVIISPQSGGYLPFTAASVLSCFISYWSKRHRMLTLRRTYKVMLLDSSPCALKTAKSRRERIAYKSFFNVFPDMDAFSLPDRTERFSCFYAPVVLIAVIALAVAASIVSPRPGSFLWCLSALSVMAVSPAMLISSSLPSNAVSRRLYHSGSAVINSKNAVSLTKCRSTVLCDEDVFPNGTVSIASMKLGEKHPLEYVYGVAASALEAVGGGLYNAFDNASKQLYAQKMPVSDVRFYESGGMSANVGGSDVLIGTDQFMRRMKINIIRDVKLKNCLYVSIDSDFAGVFSLKYEVQNSVYDAFRLLRQAKSTPFLALRDSNLTQAFIENKFKLRAESTDFPSMEKRSIYSADAPTDDEPLAIMARPGFFPLSEIILACRRLRRSVRFNTVLSLIAAVSGLFIMYFLVSNGEFSSASPSNVLLFMAAFGLPVWVLSALFTSF